MITPGQLASRTLTVANQIFSDPDKYDVVIVPTVNLKGEPVKGFVKRSEWDKVFPGIDKTPYLTPAARAREAAEAAAKAPVFTPAPADAPRMASAPGQMAYAPVTPPPTPIPVARSAQLRIDEITSGPITGEPGVSVRPVRNVTPRRFDPSKSPANRSASRPVARSARAGGLSSVGCLGCPGEIEPVDGIGDFLKKAVGVVAPIVGGIVGGPAGAALGSAIGGAVNKPKSPAVITQAEQPGAAFPGQPTTQMLAPTQSTAMGFPVATQAAGPSIAEVMLLQSQQSQQLFLQQEQAAQRRREEDARAAAEREQRAQLSALDRRAELERERLAAERESQLRRADIEQAKAQAQITAAQLAQQSNIAQAQIYAQAQAAAESSKAQIEAARLAAESQREAARIEAARQSALARAEATRLAAQRDAEASKTRQTALYVGGGLAVVGLLSFLVFRRRSA